MRAAAGNARGRASAGIPSARPPDFAGHPNANMIRATVGRITFEPGAVMEQNSQPGTGTIAVWGGEETSYSGGSTQVPIVQSVAFGYLDVDHWLQVGQGLRKGH